MCGIFGIVGSQDATPILTAALKRLEYRGYDSAGIAVAAAPGHIRRRRAVGKLSSLEEVLRHDPISGRTGIGHTRWATHGAPVLGNAHPHVSRDVAVVHNGIIENHRDLRGMLENEGFLFSSDTDTEVICHLAQHFLGLGCRPEEAARRTIAELDGAYAVAFLFASETDRLYAARRGSPLAVGYGEGEMTLGSDAVALAGHATEITYLEEDDFVVIDRVSARFSSISGQLVARARKPALVSIAATDKGGYDSFMRKEIGEQPAAIERSMRAWAPGSEGNRRLSAIEFTSVSRILIVACGTAFYAGQVARYWFERLAGIPVDLDIASEFRYREPPVPEGTLAIFVSQSGETADTLSALRYAKSLGARVVGLVNAIESSIARESDVVLPLSCGPEIGVASTKAFTGQLAVLAEMALAAATSRNAVAPSEIDGLREEMRRLPDLMRQALACEAEIRIVAEAMTTARDVIFLGRGAMFPLALEGALKLKEISYLHAEGYASGELKHGPIALVDATVPIVVLAPTDRLLEKTLSNAQEVLARDGCLILVGAARAEEALGAAASGIVRMPEVPEFLAPIVYAVPMQLLAYHVARALGRDIDQPRNLAKSVTVE